MRWRLSSGETEIDQCRPSLAGTQEIERDLESVRVVRAVAGGDQGEVLTEVCLPMAQQQRAARIIREIAGLELRQGFARGAPAGIFGRLFGKEALQHRLAPCGNKAQATARQAVVD